MNADERRLKNLGGMILVCVLCAICGCHYDALVKIEVRPQVEIRDTGTKERNKGAASRPAKETPDLLSTLLRPWP